MNGSGELKIEWARQHMPVLAKALEYVLERGGLAGTRIAVCLHLEAKTANLCLALQKAGAQVFAAASNPLSTQDEVVAALRDMGVVVFARRGESQEEYFKNIDRLVDVQPQIVIDDGADLIVRIHERQPLASHVLGACEETTTGVTRVHKLERSGRLLFPVIAVNDARSKRLFDNRYGTGQSVIDGIVRTTNLLLAGKEVVVLGYGWCGRGVAARARGMGARVTVCEVDPVKANEALMEGYQVMPALKAAEFGDLFVTVTGCSRVLGLEHFERMKDGAILCNAGHFDVEIAVDELRRAAVGRSIVRPGIEEFQMPWGKRIYLLGEGRLVNLVCGDGHPVEIMDMSFALQLLCVWHVQTMHSHLSPRLMAVPDDIDLLVARTRLEVLGVQIDSLSEQQKHYLGVT